MKKQHKNYNITTSHKEILVDFADAEANAFQASFGKDVALYEQYFQNISYTWMVIQVICD